MYTVLTSSVLCMIWSNLHLHGIFVLEQVVVQKAAVKVIVLVELSLVDLPNILKADKAILVHLDKVSNHFICKILVMIWSAATTWMFGVKLWAKNWSNIFMAMCIVLLKIKLANEFCFCLNQVFFHCKLNLGCSRSFSRIAGLNPGIWKALNYFNLNSKFYFKFKLLIH